jgi:hypothetical protein
MNGKPTRNSKKASEIPYPCLWDTTVYTSLSIVSWFTTRRLERKKEFQKGWFNYDTNSFEVPKKDWDILNKNPKFATDLAIIKNIGYSII